MIRIRVAVFGYVLASGLLVGGTAGAGPLGLVNLNPDIYTSSLNVRYDYDSVAKEGTLVATSRAVTVYNVVDQSGADLDNSLGITGFSLTARLTDSGGFRSGSFSFSNGLGVLLSGNLSAFGTYKVGDFSNLEFLGTILQTNTPSSVGFHQNGLVGVRLNSYYYTSTLLTPSSPFSSSFTGRATSSDTFATIPEPTSILLVGTGAVALWRSRRRRA
jgi:hypothetical protein